jgi:hypothetical protein
MKAGLNLRADGERVLLLDPATQQDVVIAKSEVKETNVSAVSPMPAAFETVLSEQDFFDLLEFLRSPTN